MTSLEATIETLEHQWMRAWIQRDRKAMKTLAARDFIFLMGSGRTVLLDRASWLEALDGRLLCRSYRFGSVYIRRHGTVATFASLATVEATIDGRPWTGATWIVDIWKRTGVRRRWKLVERTISRPDTDPDHPAAIQAMQLWR